MKLALSGRWRRNLGVALTAAWLVCCGGRTTAEAPEPADAGADADAEPPPLPPITESDKLDVLFVVDNSRTASFAHERLSKTIPYFIDRLVNPRCVNGLGQIVDEPDSDDDPCEVGKRDFAPLKDIHVGVLTTSLGGHGADTCSPASGNYNARQNDAARLRAEGPGGQEVDNYLGLGFLAWDPAQTKSPPGEIDQASLTSNLRKIVDGVGGDGCGYEAPLEAFYRFLIDPSPYQEIVTENDVATLVGEDEVLLRQREAFMRPDSVLLVVIITDEDDCSIRDGGQFYFAAQSQAGGNIYHLPRPRAECASDPNDPCCASCGQASPPGCPPNSPACNQGPLSEAEDPINLRCFDQKRRFGIDFLQPLDRYLEGLSNRDVADRYGQLRSNPLYVSNRSPQMVMVAAITGVPWQDIAIATTNPVAGFLPGPEVDWDRVLGDPDNGEPPTDPLMIPSREPRSGSNPVTGDALAPPEAGSPTANPINGHEHQLQDDLQFACIYQLPEPVACDTDPACECSAADATFNPVCQADSGGYDSLQRYGRATPATRPLRLIKELGGRGIVASVCPDAKFDPQLDGYGYKPAVAAMMRSIRRHLKAAQ